MIIVFLYNHILWPIAIASKLVSICYKHSSHLCTALFIKTKSWLSKPATEAAQTLDLLEEFFHFLIESKVEVNRWKRISSMNRTEWEKRRHKNKQQNNKSKANEREQTRKKNLYRLLGIWEIWCEKLDRKKAKLIFTTIKFNECFKLYNLYRTKKMNENK
jgi:hypothetical protein